MTTSHDQHEHADQMRALARSAARAEKTFWRTTEAGDIVLEDRDGRDLGQVRRELQVAVACARQLAVIADTIETQLTSTRVFGPQLPRRLRNSIETLARVVERDNGVAHALSRSGRTRPRSGRRCRPRGATRSDAARMRFNE
jgi:hypothetical protein